MSNKQKINENVVKEKRVNRRRRQPNDDNNCQQIKDKKRPKSDPNMR